MELKEKIHSAFEKRFGTDGAFYASAGRINLIGEHTDYNGGFVFPGAIDKVIMAEIKPNGTDKVRLVSVDLTTLTASSVCVRKMLQHPPGPAMCSACAARC